MSGNPLLGKKKKGTETSGVSAVLLVPFAVCVVLSAALQAGFTVSKRQIFSPSLAATTEVQACPGSSSGAFIATQAGRKLYLSRASEQLMNVCTHIQGAFVEA